MDIKELEITGRQALETVIRIYGKDSVLSGMKIVYVLTEKGVDSKTVKVVNVAKRKAPKSLSIVNKATKLFKNKTDAYYLYVLLERASEYLNKIDLNVLLPEQKQIIVNALDNIKLLEHKK